MENRGFVRFSLLGISILLTLQAHSALAYGVSVHAFLTDEVVDFYNKNYPQNKISDELRAYLVDGSRREDDPPRWMSHFYDPVNKRGLTDSILGTWQTSKEWAEDAESQEKIKYSPAIATVLSSIQNKKIEKFFPSSNFTWEQAIYYWVHGDKEMAMFALGHVVHLIQDATVPDHTRNDPHPGDSPYENYTSRFTPDSPDHGLSQKLLGKKPIQLESIGAMFDSVAAYSNNNFYSRDSIGIQSGYQLPASEDLRRDGNAWFRFFHDSEGGDYRLVQEIKPGRFNYVISSRENFTLSDPDNLIMRDYWSRLSTKAVQYSAGVINLFFEEAEKAKNNPKFLKEQPESFYSQALGTASRIVNGAGNLVNRVVTVAGDTFSQLFNGDEEGEDRILIEDSQGSGEESGVGMETDLNQVQNKGRQLAKDVRPKEDQGAQILRSPKIALDRGTLKVGEVLTQTGLGFSPNAKVLLAFKGPGGSIFNTEVFTDAGGSYRNAFQVSGVLGVYTLTAKDGVSGIGSNEVSYMLVAVVQEHATTSPQETQVVAPVTISSGGQMCAFADAASPSRNLVLINEVAWMGTNISSADEWIELKNISNVEVDLSGWRLVDKGGQIAVSFGERDKKGVVRTKIPARGFYLLERTDDESVPGVSADFVYSGALSDSDEGIKLLDENCRLADEAIADTGSSKNWSGGEKETKRTLERDSVGFGWHTSSLMGGTPRQENSTPYITGPAGSGQASAQNPKSDSVAPPMGHVLISEVQIAGQSASDEFVELYNPNGTAIDLSGWFLKRKSASGTEYALVASSRLEGKSIPASGYFLLANEGGYTSVIASDVGWPKSSGLAANNTVVLYRADGQVSDKVGFGSASDFEGVAFGQSPDVGYSISRNSQSDSDNNAADFVLSNPTPQNSGMQDGFLSPDALGAAAKGSALVSEVSIDMSGADTGEFVELYNPGFSNLILGDWSLQYLSGSDSSWEGIAKKNFPQGAMIPARGFYLVGMGEYSATTTPDMTWSQSLNNTGGVLLLVKNTDPVEASDDADIADRVAYGTGEAVVLLGGASEVIGMPPEGESLERRALVGGECATPLEAGEFSGNACDTGKSADFVSRPLPHPQAARYLAEPRVLSLPQNISIEFVSSTAELALAWSAPEEGGLGEGIMYQVEEASSSIVYATSSEASARVSTRETGRTYAFEIRVIDREGMSSDAVSVSLYVSGVPLLSRELSADFNEVDSKLEIGWQAATDPDTNAEDLSYEISVATSSDPENWQSIDQDDSFQIDVVSGDHFYIKVRARDELGNLSNVLETEWSYPSVQVANSGIIFEFSSGDDNYIWAGGNKTPKNNTALMNLGNPLLGTATSTFNAHFQLYFNNNNVEMCDSRNVVTLNEYSDQEYSQHTGTKFHFEIPTSTSEYGNGMSGVLTATSSGSFSVDRFYQLQLSNCFSDPFGEAYNKSTGLKGSGEGSATYSDNGLYASKPPAIKIYLPVQ